jgi:solute carrier family 10 (sodium/bile acid cotransporter), member 3/5
LKTYKEVLNCPTWILGTTKIRLLWPRTGNLSDDFLLVQISKDKTVVDIVFAVLVVILVVILSIIIGTAIDLTVVRGIVTRPIGPIIGFVSQFMFMPLVSEKVT